MEKQTKEINGEEIGGLLETWKDVKGYEGLYQVSNFGRARSLDTIGDNGRVYKGIIKTLSDNGKGYLYVKLKVKGVQKAAYIHRLVAEAFIPNPENKPEVNHKDGDKSNNFPTNLEWNTKLENVRHSFENGFNKGAGAPKKIFVFDGDNTVMYSSYTELGLSIGKSSSWCAKRLGEGDQFNYNGLTISKKESDFGTKVIFNVDDIGEIQDGSHSVSELYHHRMILFATICNLQPEKAWKSKLHADGTMYDDYFIAGIQTPEGQFSYHYHLDHWNQFDVVEIGYAPEWDGHVSDDVTRLLSLTKKQPQHHILWESRTGTPRCKICQQVVTDYDSLCLQTEPIVVENSMYQFHYKGVSFVQLRYDKWLGTTISHKELDQELNKYPWTYTSDPKIIERLENVLSTPGWEWTEPRENVAFKFRLNEQESQTAKFLKLPTVYEVIPNPTGDNMQVWCTPEDGGDDEYAIYTKDAVKQKIDEGIWIVIEDSK